MARKEEATIITEAEANEILEEELSEKGIPENAEEVQYSLIEGLLKAANYKDDPDLRETLVIRRNGQNLFKFTIRPLSEEELKLCRKKSTEFMKNPAGRNLPKVEKEVDYVKVRCWKIYLATIDEDKERIWNNKELREKLDVFTGPDMVERLLTSGEKNAVSDKIDTISGFDTDIDEYAKN